jgi:threonine/homoserine/homoserine lactone efflux protein
MPVLLISCGSHGKHGRDDIAGLPDADRNNTHLTAWFRHGLLLNLLNPKAAVFFIAVLPAYIAPNLPAVKQSMLLTLGYVSIATAAHLLIVLLAGQAHDWLSSAARQRNARRLFALLLALVAVWFLVSTRSSMPSLK